MRRQLSTRITLSSTALVAGVAALLAFAGAAALARVLHPTPGAPAGHAARAQRLSGAVRRARGARGARGPQGPQGVPGAQGATGPAGVAQVMEQDISLNWEGGFANSAGRDTSSFVAPGIGVAAVTCNQNTQWIHFQPYDANTDVAMWTAKFQGNETTVRTARHTTFTGATFYEGLNHYAGEPASTGEIVGIISTRGKLGGSNGAGVAPTTFRLSWNWDFTDPSNPYCFIAGTVNSNGG